MITSGKRKEIQNSFDIISHKIQDLVFILKDFSILTTEILASRTSKALERINLQNEKRNSKLEMEAYKEIRQKIENNDENDDFLEKKVLQLNKEIKFLSNILNDFENGFIDLIINQVSSNDIFHVKVNVLMQEFKKSLND